MGNGTGAEGSDRQRLRFPVVMLQKIFRQAGESDIVVNAHRIHRGEQIRMDNKSRDFFFLERNNINVIYKHMVMLITEKLPRYVKIRYV